MVQEVQALNKRIEAINVQRTRAEAKVEMLKKQLVAAIGKYNETYGVNLGDKSFAKLSGKVKAELGKVTSALQVEFELKEKVVSAIENQQYEEAYRLLGVVPEADEDTPEDDGTLEEENRSFKVQEEVIAEGILATEEVSVEDEGSLEMESSDGEFMDFGDVDFGIEGEEAVEEEIVEESSSPATSEKVKGESAVEAVESMDMVVEEDEIPNVDMDFGFGDMLSGTKFEA